MNNFICIDKLSQKWRELTGKTNDWRGYVCLSGSPNIREIDGGLEPFDGLNQDNNFIFESNIYSQKLKLSVSIRHLDRGWLITEIDHMQNPSGAILVEHEYISRIKKKMRFIEAWLPEKDELCEGMEVLKPAWMAFKGFKEVGE